MILSQILGTSFGRSPTMGGGGGVHMPPLPQVQMYEAPQRPVAPAAPPTAPASAAPATTPQQNAVVGSTPVSAAPNTGGIMNTIMKAFNSGAGGGMDLAKLLTMIGAG